jgi:hypothetical protein
MNILNPKFKYVHSTATDIRKTFARIKREQAKQEATNAQEQVSIPGADAKSDRRRAVGSVTVQ